MKDTIQLRYAGKTVEHRIIRADIAEFIAERYIKKADRPHVEAQVKDALAILEIAFHIGERIGYEELFGKNPEFKRFLLERMVSNG